MSGEIARANQQFEHAKKRSAEIVHQQMADAVRKQHEDTIINNNGGYGVPGFIFVHTTHRNLELTDPHALDDLVEP